MWFILAILAGLGVAADQGKIDLGEGVVDVVECNNVMRLCNDERDMMERERFTPEPPTTPEPPVGDDDDDGDDDDGNNGHGNDDDHDDDSNPGKGKGKDKGWGKGGKPGNPGKGHDK